MKVCVLLFGMIVFMLTTALSPLAGIKKCRKQLALISYVSDMANQGEKQQTPNTTKSTDGTCNSFAPLAVISQQSVPTLVLVTAKEFNRLNTPPNTSQYIDPPFAPPRLQKDSHSNLF